MEEEISKNEELTKELDEIYGIEKCKKEILSYTRYLNFPKEKSFANYNMIIYNNSVYPSETQDKLIELLYKKLKENGIVEAGYEYINGKLIKKIEMDNSELENFYFKNDLIIIDSDKIGRSLEAYREEISKIIEKFSDKVFFIIDKGFCVGMTNATFNKYFDWFIEIDRISDDEKRKYILNFLSKNNISVEEKCLSLDECSKDPLYKIKPKLNELTLYCKINNIDTITDEITKEVFEETIITETKEKRKVEREEKINFDSLIGIENIKDEVEKIINYAKLCKKRNKKLPTLHMCFKGNPGTGKTTIARIIGERFKEERILSTGKFIEIDGRSLIDKYVGWTDKKVRDYIQKAKGGVLFIDEAYSLCSDRKGSYEDEAIATLIKEMEDKRDDICIILAGYEKEMDELISRNPGFESRIQFHINFSNYDEEQLFEIFKNLAKKEEYKISSQIKEILFEKFREDKNDYNFSNGRYVRNLFEKVKIEQANRVMQNHDKDINLIKKIDITTVLENNNSKTEKRIKNVIGFAG